MSCTNRGGIGNQGLVLQVVDVILLEAIGEAIAEFQFGDELEERKIEVAA